MPPPAARRGPVRKGAMDLLIVAIVVIVCLASQLVILPRLGVPT